MSDDACKRAALCSQHPQPEHEADAKAELDGRSPASSVSSGSSPSSGAPLSNTAPAICTNPSDGTRILGARVDSLYVSIPGKLFEGVGVELADVKELAKSEDPRIRSTAQYVFGDHVFEVRDRGKGRFPFVLVDNHFHLQVAARRASALPLLYAQISSEVLTRCGVEAPVRDLDFLSLSLGETTDFPRLSRVDLCVDFTTPFRFDAYPQDGWVGRWQTLGSFLKHGRLSGYTFGRGGELSARLYDKTLEITQSHKDYLKAIWSEHGWNGTDQVWRLEFQFRRSVLKELGVGYTRDLKANLGGLWRYACENWLRMVELCGSDQTRSRWPTHPLWTVLTAADWADAPSEPLSRVTTARTPSDDRLFVNGLAGLTSFMAREGIESLEEGAQAFLEAAERFHREREPDSSAQIERYVDVKRREKIRRYNLLASNARKAVRREE